MAMAFSWVLRSNTEETTLPRRRRRAVEVHDTIHLRIDDGLLMAFGPDGDPVPPAMLRSASNSGTKGFLELDSGAVVDSQRVLEIFNAQRKGGHADYRSDGWVRAMLGLEGTYEPTPAELLEQEPDDPLPAIPDTPVDAEELDLGLADLDLGLVEASSPEPEEQHPSQETRTASISFDVPEHAMMAKADALVFQGLPEGIALSAGNFDPMLKAWVLRPSDTESLTLSAETDMPDSITFDVDAVIIRGEGDRWPIGTKTVHLA
jgi:hypothetical protein